MKDNAEKLRNLRFQWLQTGSRWDLLERPGNDIRYLPEHTLNMYFCAMIFATGY